MSGKQPAMKLAQEEELKVTFNVGKRYFKPFLKVKSNVAIEFVLFPTVSSEQQISSANISSIYY